MSFFRHYQKAAPAQRRAFIAGFNGRSLSEFDAEQAATKAARRVAHAAATARNAARRAARTA